MALYPICQTSILNIELCHGCFTIFIVYQYMLSSFMSYAKVLVRRDDPGTDRGSLCFRACSSVLLIHLKGGRLGDARVVTSCTSVVLGYAGSFRYARAPRSCRGSPRKVTTPLVHHSVLAVVSVVPHVRVRGRSSCKDVTPRMYFGVGHSP